FVMNRFTNASLDSTLISYETRKPAVGMHEYGGVKLQLVEIPSTTGELEPELLSIVRNCDFILFVAREAGQAEQIAKTLENSHIRLNKEPKRIKVVRKPKGGLVVSGAKRFVGDAKEMKQLLRSSGLHNAEVMLYEKTGLEDIEDFLEESTAYKKCLVLTNGTFKTELKKVGFSSLMDRIWNVLGLIRVYTKEPGKNKTGEPLVFGKDSTVKMVGRKIHKDFIRKFRFARVWGKSAKFDSQMVGLSHHLEDGDVVEFHLR
ncbi:MAG: TGS domain-containing protein, partial [Candidatus Aenigmarchaeota archaeon]|nr:TGS domain-containing protein [Candidatus Aenigmarchaeota archaeon]